MSVAFADLTALRRAIRDRRAALPPAFRIAAAQQLAGRLSSLTLIPASGYVAGYWAVGGEIALHAWQTSLSPQHVYCLPVLSGESLLFAPWRPGDALVANRFGIPEPDCATSSLLDPAALSAIVVPLVAFDDVGNRVGMGGGWYDRALAPLQGESTRPFLVGAAYDLQRVGSLSPQPWDVRLDAVCTESATYIAANIP